MNPLVSIIIPTRNEGDYLKKTIDFVESRTDYTNYEIVVAYDEASDIEYINADNYNHVKKINVNGLGPAISRNMAVVESKGDVLVFIDSHVFPLSNGWLTEMVNFLMNNKKTICTPAIAIHNRADVKGYGLKINPDLSVEWLHKSGDKPYHVPIACACCMAVRRIDFFKIGMFNSSFIKWGSEDTEFSIRAWLLGYEVFVLPSVEVEHLFKENFSYNIEWKDLDVNSLRMAYTHFSEERISRAIENMKKTRDIDEALNMVSESDVFSERKRLMKKRLYDDDWFFRKFGIDF